MHWLVVYVGLYSSRMILHSKVRVHYVDTHSGSFHLRFLEDIPSDKRHIEQNKVNKRTPPIAGGVLLF